MTQDEFDKTAFRKGDRVRTKEGTFEVLRVDRDDEELPILATSSRWFGLDEILEYIPVEVELKEKPLADSTNKHETDEERKLWIETFLIDWRRENYRPINSSIDYANLAVQEFKNAFKNQ